MDHTYTLSTSSQPTTTFFRGQPSMTRWCNVHYVVYKFVKILQAVWNYIRIPSKFSKIQKFQLFNLLLSDLFYAMFQSRKNERILFFRIFF